MYQVPEDFGCASGWGVAGNAQKFQKGYDDLVAAGGGRIHLPERYYMTTPLHLYSETVVITGDGPRTGFWFQLADPTKDAFVVEPLNAGSPTAFLQLVEMRDFSVLGGADCATNLIRIQFVLRSRFKGIHAMGNTRAHPIAIRTGWCNQFELVASYAGQGALYTSTSWGHTPGRPRSDYLHLMGSDPHRGGLNANHFWLLIEGFGYAPTETPDTYNLVRISNQNGPAQFYDEATQTWTPGTWTDQGNNWITGTVEGNVGGYALYADNCDTLCLDQLYAEGTQGIALVNCRQPTVTQTRWFTNLFLDGCVAPSVRHSTGDTLVIEASTKHAEIGHLIVGQGSGTVINNSPSTVTTGPILVANPNDALLGGGIFTSTAAVPAFRNQTAIVGTDAYISVGVSATTDWRKITP
jgi:hypothetical protein